MATWHTKPERATAVPTILHQGVTADRREDKPRIFMDTSFLEPVPYEGDEGQRGLPGGAFRTVSPELVVASRGTSSKKSPGLDGVGLLVIRRVYDGEPDRVVAPIRARIRLSTHPDRWKTARGVTIPKPGKDNYGLAKSYRVISLLNCLGKMVEEVAAMLLSAHCEATDSFTPAGTASGPSDRRWTWELPSLRPKRLGAGGGSQEHSYWAWQRPSPTWQGTPTSKDAQSGAA